MRLELKNGINNCRMINDVYSADISSLKIALHFLHQQSTYSANKINHLILSDIDEAGATATEIVKQVIALLIENNIHKFHYHNYKLLPLP